MRDTISPPLLCHCGSVDFRDTYDRFQHRHRECIECGKIEKLEDSEADTRRTFYERIQAFYRSKTTTNKA